MRYREPAAEGRGMSILKTAAPFVLASEVQGMTAQVDVSGIDAGSLVLFQVQVRNLNSEEYRSEASATAAVQLDAVVPPVRSLRVSETSTNSISVSWGAPAWYVSEFTLSISRLLGADAWGGVGVVAQAGDIIGTEIVKSGKRQDHTFTELLPNTSYLISVTAHSLLVRDDAVGEGRSANVTTRTYGKPMSTPHGLKALSVGADSLALLWEHDAVAGSSITHFRLLLNASDNGHGSNSPEERRNKVLVSFGEEPPGDGGLVCEGLMPSSEYRVSVASCGLGGCSDYHARNFWTAPYSPLDFAVQTISTTPPDISVTLQWKAPCAVTLEAVEAYPGGNGDPTPSCPSQITSSLDIRYLVSHRRIVTSSSYTPWTDETSSDGGGRDRSIKLSGLTSGEDYQVRLVAIYQGVRSEPVFLTAKITSMPLSVEEFGIAPDSHQGVLEESLTLRWRAPGASPVSHYKLSWAKIDETNDNSGRVSPYEANGGGLGNAQSGVLEFDMRLHNEFANFSVSVHCAFISVPKSGNRRIGGVGSSLGR